MEDIIFTISIVVATTVCLIGMILAISQGSTNTGTPEETRAKTYYNCVRVQYDNGRDIDNCNKIK